MRTSWHSHLPHSPVIVHHAPEDISCLNRSRILTNNSIGNSMDVIVSDQNNKCAPGSTTTYPAEVPLESSTHVMARYTSAIILKLYNIAAIICNRLRALNIREAHAILLCYCAQIRRPFHLCGWIFLLYFILDRFFPGFVRDSMPRVESHLNAESVAVDQAAGDIAILRVDVDM